MNSFVNDLFERIAAEASKLAQDWVQRHGSLQDWKIAAEQAAGFSSFGNVGGESGPRTSQRVLQRGETSIAGPSRSWRGYLLFQLHLLISCSSGERDQSV